MRDEIIHAANVLVCGAALTTADTVTAGAASVIAGLLSWREVSRRTTPEMDDLAAKVQADLANLTKGKTSDDPTYHLPDMIAGTGLQPADVLEARWDAAQLAEELWKRAAPMQADYATDAYRTVFLREVGAILTGLLADPRMVDVVAPAFQRDVLDMLCSLQRGQENQDRELAEIKAVLGSLQAGLQNPGALSRSQLVALAGLFGVGDAGDYTDAKLHDLLQGKAQEYQGLKAQVDAINEQTAGLGNLKAAAQDAIARLDFAEVEELLSRVDEVETGIVAETKELRARNALLRGRVEDAARHFRAAADAFANLDPLETARRRSGYAGELHDHGVRYGDNGLARAADLWRAALEVYTRDQHPVEWAATQNNLAIALRNQGVRIGGSEGTALLGEAVAAYRAALEVRTRDQHPVEWARTQNNLGNALRNQGERSGGSEGVALLGEAVTAFRAVLEIYTRDQHPVHWAGTQNNLGNALSNQGERSGGAEGAALLGEAVTAYRAALEVYTRDQHPVHWATTQYNLGNALSNQGERSGGAEGAALLAEAVAAFRAALEVYTRDQHPVHWATTQNSLAIALRNQGAHIGGAEGAALLAEAVAAVRAALEVRTRDQHPVQWAMTQQNLAITHLAWAGLDGADALEHLQTALDHVMAALEVYDPEHMSYHHGTATALRADIQKRLDAARGR